MPATRSEKLAFLFIAPSFFLIFFFMLYPLFDSIRNSLYLFRGSLTPKAFVGLSHYLNMLRDPYLVNSFAVTFKFAILYIAGSLGLGLALALILNEKFKGKPIYRTLIIIPWAISPVANAVIWGCILHPTWGIANIMLTSLGLIKTNYVFVGDPKAAIFWVCLVTLWKDLPFFSFVLLGALQGIGEELYEAAKVDGANALMRFRHVSLPGVRKVLVTLLILDTIWTVRIFDVVYVMTYGGPGRSSEVVAYRIWQQFFRYKNLGYASAMSVFLVMICAVFSVIYFKYFYGE